MRGRRAFARAPAARSTSILVQRASAAACTAGNSRLTASTASKSPSEAIGKPGFEDVHARVQTSFPAMRLLRVRSCCNRVTVRHPGTRIEDPGARLFIVGRYSTSRYVLERGSIKQIYYHSWFGISGSYDWRNGDCVPCWVFMTVASRRSYLQRAAIKLSRTLPGGFAGAAAAGE